jgi:hypothetical protein
MMAIKKGDKRIFTPGGAQVPKMQSTQNRHGKDCGIAFADSAPIPRMQAVNNGGQDIKKGASIPKMTPAQTPSGPTSSGSRQGSNSQTAKPGGDKKK